MILYTHARTHGYKLKEKVYGIIKLVVFLSLLFVCFFIVNNIVKRKEPYERKRDFINQEENFDVLFFGSSHIMNAAFPMRLWQNYGIVSYNLGNQGEKVGTSYYNMKLACKYTKPKLIVIDTYMIYERNITR